MHSTVIMFHTGVSLKLSGLVVDALFSHVVFERVVCILYIDCCIHIVYGEQIIAQSFIAANNLHARL